MSRCGSLAAPWQNANWKEVREQGAEHLRSTDGECPELTSDKPQDTAAPTESPPTQDSRHSGQGCLCHSAASELGSWVCASDGWEAPGLPQQVWLPALGPVLRALAPPAGKIRNELSVTVQCQRLQKEAEEGGTRGGRYHHHCPQPCSLKVNILSCLRVFSSSFHPHHSNRRSLGPSYS